MTDPIFTEGLYLNKVSDNAPSSIVANVSVHLEKAIAWMQANKHLADEKGYIRLTGKESKQGKRYFQVDTWKPTTETRSTVSDEHSIDPNEELNPEAIPF